MPVVKFTTTVYSMGSEIKMTPSPEYDSVVRLAIERIESRAQKVGEFPTLDVTVEWHAKKRSLDQLKLFWSILEIAASLQSTARIPSPGEIRRLANSLYDDYLENHAPRTEIIVNADSEGIIRQQFNHVKVRKVLDDGRIYIVAITGASLWTMEQMTGAIDYWFNELASIGVKWDDEAGFAYYWREWRIHLAANGIDIINPESDITPEEYRERTPISECCGAWLGAGGEIAHIKARGAGGNVDPETDKPWRWLHLCTDHHRFLQHQKGWAPLVKIAPWLKPKIDKALGRKRK